MPADLPDLPDVADEVLLSHPSQFEALDSGLRMRMLSLCREPLAAREIAEFFDMPVTSVYYHVNLLQSAGLLEVVHTRKSGARLEKIYRVAGRTIRPGPGLLENVEDAGAAAKAMASLVIEPAKGEAEVLIRGRLEGGERHGSIGRTVARLTDDQFREIESRLEAVVSEVIAEGGGEDRRDVPSYAFTYVFVRTDPDA